LTEEFCQQNDDDEDQATLHQQLQEPVKGMLGHLKYHIEMCPNPFLLKRFP
jgi:hypothetical protein